MTPRRLFWSAGVLLAVGYLLSGVTQVRPGEGDWGVGYAKTLGAFMNGKAMTERDRAGARIADDSFFVMFNSYREPMEFKLPPKKWGRKWTIILDTSDAMAPKPLRSYAFEERVHLAGHTMVVLRRVA